MNPSWAPAPDPDLPPISSRRAYTEVLGVFAGFFLVGVVAAALLLGGRGADLRPGGSWGLYGVNALQLVIDIGLAVAVVLLLSARRGVGPADLGLRVPRRADGRVAAGLSLRVAAWSLFGLVVGGILNYLLQTGHLPVDTPTAPELVFAMVDSVQAGVIEELVVLAFVVVTLRQARRPWWEVTVAALLLRGSYHIYYGPGVFGIMLWAGIYYWVYVRHRQVLPMMICHAGWDAVGFLSQRWPGVTVAAMLIVVAIWVAAPIVWLVERNDRQPAWPSGPPVWPTGGGARPGWPGHDHWPGAAGRSAEQAGWPPGTPVTATGPPPGWHPDPAGLNRWRWWDGWQWTDYVSHHGTG